MYGDCAFELPNKQRGKRRKSRCVYNLVSQLYKTFINKTMQLGAVGSTIIALVLRRDTDTLCLNRTKCSIEINTISEQGDYKK